MGKSENTLYLAALFFTWVLLSNLTLLNMLVGVLCQVVMAVAEAEKEKRESETIKEKVAKLWDKCLQADKDNDGSIDVTEFREICKILRPCDFWMVSVSMCSCSTT